MRALLAAALQMAMKAGLSPFFQAELRRLLGTSRLGSLKNIFSKFPFSFESIVTHDFFRRIIPIGHYSLSTVYH